MGHGLVLRPTLHMNRSAMRAVRTILRPADLDEPLFRRRVIRERLGQLNQRHPFSVVLAGGLPWHARLAFASEESCPKCRIVSTSFGHDCMKFPIENAENARQPSHLGTGCVSLTSHMLWIPRGDGKRKAGPRAFGLREERGQRTPSVTSGKRGGIKVCD